MDSVSRLLDERERTRPGFFPWIVIAALLHGAAASAVFLAARENTPQPAHLPAVSVRLVQPAPVIRRSAPSSGSPARPTAQPRPVPTTAPTAAPAAAPAPTAPPRPATDEPSKPTEEAPSASAMPPTDTRATPATPPSPGGSGETGEPGRGLSLGGGTGGDAEAGAPADFQFTYYLERMLALIESRWYKPPSPAGTRARVRFQILSSGQVEGIVLEQSSGQPAFDRAVLRALYAANPLPPLPPAYRKPSLTIHLTFSE